VESTELARVGTGGDEPQATPGDPNEDPFCSFWKGTDLRVCTEVCTVLDEAGIQHKTIRRQDHLFNLNNQAPYEVGVPASLYEKAELAIKDAFGTDAEGSEDAVYESQAPRLLPDAADHASKAGIFAPLLDIVKSRKRHLRALRGERCKDGSLRVAGRGTARQRDRARDYGRSSTGVAFTTQKDRESRS
jgi:hypothetical protein